MRVAAEETLRRFRLDSSAEHTPSLPSRGPCLLTPRTGDGAVARGPVRRTARLAAMRVADRWAGIPRSLVQLVLGSYMVWDARRQGLCRNYFAGPPSGGSPSSGSPAPSGAPASPNAPTAPGDPTSPAAPANPAAPTADSRRQRPLRRTGR